MGRFSCSRYLVYIAAILSFAGLDAAAHERCEFTPIDNTRVSSIRDGRTLVLDDGRELRLAGIEVRDESGTILRHLTMGHTLTGFNGIRDRYNRLFGFAFIEGSHMSLQEMLLTQGAARVGVRIDSMNCAQTLFTIERAARAAHRGLWADPNFAPLQANDITRIETARGQFTLIEGKVFSVRESGATIYLNFGRYWTRDFSVTIPRRLEKRFAAAGIDIKQLTGKRIRIRGWIEQRRGPIISTDMPEQIEFVD